MRALLALVVAAAVAAWAPPLCAHGVVDIAVRSTAPPFVPRGGAAALDIVVDVMAFDPAYGVIVDMTLAGSSRITGVQAGTEWRCDRGPERVRCAAEELGPGPHTIRLDLSVPAAETAVRVTLTAEAIGIVDPQPVNNSAVIERRTYDPAACQQPAPLLLSADGALRWAPVAGASSYEILAGIDGETLRPIAQTPETTLVWRFTGGEVAWRVRALFDECPPAESESGSFVSTASLPRLFVTPVASSVLRRPAGVARVGSQILVSDAEARKFFAYDVAAQTLSPLPLFGDIIETPPSIDAGFAEGPGEYLFFVDRANHAVWFGYPPPRSVFPIAGRLRQSGFVDRGGVGARFASPTAIAVNAKSELFVTDTGNNAIRRIVYSGGSVSDFVVTTVARGLNQPSGIAIAPDGSLVVADRGSNTVVRVTPAGVVTTLAGQPGVAGHVDGAAAVALFDEPYGIVIDERGNIYVSELGNRSIRKIAPNGRVTTLAAGIVERPGLITVTSDGTLWIPDEANGRLLRGTLLSGPRRRAVSR